MDDVAATFAMSVNNPAPALACDRRLHPDR